MPRVVTLTTDFGAGSVYVAQLKGALFRAPAPPTIVDLSHDLPPHDPRAAAWFVGRACPAFPPGAIHAVVVDPGVGTARRLLHARIGDHDYLAPDNGLLTLAIRRGGLAWAREIAVPAGAAATFHGRDVIAPYAATLLEGRAGGAGKGEGGAPPAGPALDPVLLTWPEPHAAADGAVRGEVVHVDAFGNLVTDLPATFLPRLLAAGRILVGGRVVPRVVRTYGEAPAGSLVALVGSQDALEVAVVEGSAAERLAATLGTPVTIPAPGAAPGE
jgi:S-adenosylmethionine hydrolase